MQCIMFAVISYPSHGNWTSQFFRNIHTFACLDVVGCDADLELDEAVSIGDVETGLARGETVKVSEAVTSADDVTFL